MATRRQTVDDLLARLKSPRFSARAMFGEYALYGDGKVVALVCDDRLYVKVHPASQGLSGSCELGPPYPGARDHYVLDEGEWMARDDLPRLLLGLAAALPAPKPRRR